MTTPPTPRPEPVLDYTARLLPLGHVLDEDGLDPTPFDWTVTFGLGKPAAGTYATVRFTSEALIAPDSTPHPEHVLDAVVRRVARDLYGTAWAFHYRPDQYADSIARYAMRRRELIVVESVEVYA